MPAEGITVLLADDHALIRTGNALVLGSAEGVEVVGEAADGEEAVELARALRPDIVLMDVRMPGMDGIEATRRITSELPGTRVIVLTTFDLDAYAFETLRAGASAFLVKSATAEELLEAVRTVAASEEVYAPRATARLVEHHAQAASEASGPSPREVLSARELEVLAAIAEGASNPEIARRLSIEVSTVKSHVHRLLAKLAARDRVHLVLIAIEHGLAEG